MLEKRTEAAEEKFNQAELLNQRLKEVFSVKISEFRQACYELTGYKITMSGSKYRLRSMYAELEDDDLLFQRGENESLCVLETPFARRLDKKSVEVLSRFHSIPLFLSTVTEELFEKQTMRAGLG